MVSAKYPCSFMVSVSNVDFPCLKPSMQLNSPCIYHFIIVLVIYVLFQCCASSATCTSYIFISRKQSWEHFQKSVAVEPWNKQCLTTMFWFVETESSRDRSATSSRVFVLMISRAFSPFVISKWLLRFSKGRSYIWKRLYSVVKMFVAHYSIT